MEMIEERPRCCAWKLPGRPSWYASPMPVGAVQCVLSQDHHGDHRLPEPMIEGKSYPMSATRPSYLDVPIYTREQISSAPPPKLNSDARSLLDELANRIDGASLDAKLSNDEWRVWSKLSTMIRQVLRGPDLIEQPSLVEGQMPKHAFKRAERNSGSRWNGPPEETCWFCGTDPRNAIHEQTITDGSLIDLVAIAFDVSRDTVKAKLIRALYTKPPGEDHESQATHDRDPRDDKPGNG